MGYIRQKPNGTYAYTISLGIVDSKGRYKQKSKGGFKTKTECKKAMIAAETAVSKGEYYEESKLTLEMYLKKWLENIEHNIAESTFVAYKDICNRVLTPAFGTVHIDKLKALQIQSFLTKQINENKLSTTTVRKNYNILNIALNQAVKWQLIQVNPCTAVEPPKLAKTKIEVLKPHEVDILLNYTKESEFKVMYVPLILALTCGMRRGEVLGLQWEDVDFEAGVIRIKNNMVKVWYKATMTTPKTDDSVRTIVMLPTTIKVLKEHKENQKVILFNAGSKSNFVCTWSDGRHLKPDYLTQTFKKLVKRCGVSDVRFHDLRHTHATLLLLSKVSPKVVAERLGHSKVDITLDTYSHVLPTMQNEAVLALENTLFKDAK